VFNIDIEVCGRWRVVTVEALSKSSSEVPGQAGEIVMEG
jgi:hypothetical protein